MARMPDIEWVGEFGKRAMNKYDIVCLHTIVGRAPAHAAHFSVSMDGVIFQSRDTKYQSAANFEGNPRVIAIETADMPPTWEINNGRAVPDFTDEQVNAIIKILVWVNKTHGIPIVPCPNSRPGSKGIAYHRQGIDGNFDSYAYPGRVPGGEHWSKSFGKVCPGDRKIKTLLYKIIPRAAFLIQPPIPPKPPIVPPIPIPPQEETMATQPFRLYKVDGTGPEADKVYVVPSTLAYKKHVKTQELLQGYKQALYVEAAHAEAEKWSAEVMVLPATSSLWLLIKSLPDLPT